MALAARDEAHRDGLRYTVDGDLQRFFDTAPRRGLLNRRASRLNDRRGLRRMSRSWRAGGLLPDGRREQTLCGVPPGGPLAPLLAHVMLEDRDVERERRGLRCAREAAAVRTFVRSQAAAQRVWHSSSHCLEGCWRRRITGTKSQAARLSAGAFRGVELKRGQWRWTEAAGKRFTERLRELTARRHGRSMASRIEALQRSVTGWLTYVGHRPS
jgi:RNA-directed DNA polymerase